PSKTGGCHESDRRSPAWRAPTGRGSAWRRRQTCVKRKGSAPEGWLGRVDGRAAVGERRVAVGDLEQGSVEDDEAAELRGQHRGRHRERGAEHVADHELEAARAALLDHAYRLREPAALVELDVDH